MLLPVLAAMPPLTRSVSAQSSMGAAAVVVSGEVSRPLSRQRQRSMTHTVRTELLECVSPADSLPARRLPVQPQVSTVREEEEN